MNRYELEKEIEDLRNYTKNLRADGKCMLGETVEEIELEIKILQAEIDELVNNEKIAKEETEKREKRREEERIQEIFETFKISIDKYNLEKNTTRLVYRILKINEMQYNQLEGTLKTLGIKVNLKAELSNLFKAGYIEKQRIEMYRQVGNRKRNIHYVPVYKTIYKTIK